MNQLKEKLAVLPDQPGCYLMKNKHGKIIYIGKARILKNRVRSYFSGSHDPKTERLVSEIVDFEYIVTSSELEALILEMNLIKEHDPKYNVMMRDDKSYPFLKITNERQPRLITTRKINRKTGKYFGPYPNAGAANETKKLLDRLYPLRKCRTMPDRVCLYYHINQCLAPCVFNVTEEQNRKMVEGIESFLKGGYRKTKQDLQEKMKAASETLNFEHAKELRDQIHHIETVMEKQKMMLNDFNNRDVFAYAYDKGWMCVQVFFIRQGKMIERDASLFPIYDEPEEAFLTFLGQFYLQKNHIRPREIFIPQSTDEATVSKMLDIHVHRPVRGKKKDLVELAKKNAAIALKEKFALIERDERRTIQAVENLGSQLNIDTPHRIEAFDNSNIQGADPVSAMVVFEDGKPLKNDYRKYRIKTVEGPDDYGSMREVIRRRYTRLLKEDGQLPDLILIDGGKGQLAAAEEVLENELGLLVPICGLAKDEKHRSSQLIMGDPPQAVQLKRNSQEFYLLQRIQDEVHRFAITFHRQVRGKSMIKSSLDGIDGVGEKRKRKLLRHFGSVKKIKEASIDDLKSSGLPGQIAETVYLHFQESTSDK